MSAGARLLAFMLAVGSSSVLAPLAAQERPNRSKPPTVGPPPPLNLPPIQRRALANGLAVWVVEAREVPLVQVNLLLQAGSGDDPAGKYGVANLTAAMLDEGAGPRSALDVADAVELLGATLTTASSSDASSIRLNVPVAMLNDALPIMADVALRPTFPAPDLERLRQERLTTLLQARDDPASIAMLAFVRLLFGPTHRYGTGQAGTAASLKALTAQDLRAFHSTYYQPSNAAVIVVGDVKGDAALAQLEAAFGGWKHGGAVKRAPVPAGTQVKARQVYIVDKPGAEQSQIRIGGIGVPRNTPEYFTLQVLNTVLGGSFSSRLNLNLREKHGYAYGASSEFDMRLSAGAFLASAGVQTDKTADALREFFNELSGIGNPIGPQELARAKNYVALSFPGEFETTSDLSRRLEELIVYGLPDTYFEQYVARIQSVTPADVQKAAATYVRPTQSIVVVVGDRKTIEPGIRALKLGPVQLLTVDEALDGRPAR